MSIDHDPDRAGSPSDAPPSLDLSGLPDSAVSELRNLVATLRASFPAAPAPLSVPTEESSADWARRLQTWVDSHPARDIVIGDNRETIYAGRGE